MVDLCFLGTGGSMPIPDRALASLYVRVNGRTLLIDCGENTQTGIRRCGWGFRCMDALLLTHYHGDHCGGLPGLLISLAKAGRTEPFDIFGCSGLKEILRGLCVIVPPLPYELRLHELREDCEFRAIGMRIRAFRLLHGVPCFGYRFDLERTPAFDPEKAKALRIPVALWSELKRGESVTVEERRVLPEEVLGDARRGISFLYATDTRPVQAIVDYGTDTELMILEGMYGDEKKRPQALKNKHMLFSEAARAAARAGTGRLILTHFSTSVEHPEEAIPAAREIFEHTDAAEDGMTVTLRYPP